MAEHRKTAHGLGLALLLLSGAPACAEPAIDCAKATATPEIAFCAEKDFKAADTALNDAYRALLAKIDASAGSGDNAAATQARSWREAVTEAQRKWIAFRDADCAAVGTAWNGGTGMGAAVSGCLAEATRARTAALKLRAQDGN